MTRRPPHPISEDELLDLVEGNLPDERVEELMPSLRADPDLAARLKAMAHDRQTVKSALGAPYTAPGGMLEGAFARADAARESASAVAAGTTPSIPRLIGSLAAGVAITLGVAFAAQSYLFNESDSRERIASGDPLIDLGGRQFAQLPPELSPEPVGDETPEPVRSLANAQAPAPAIETTPAPSAIVRLGDEEIARAVRFALAGELVLVIGSPDETLPFASLADAGTVRDGSGRVLASPALLASGDHQSDADRILALRVTDTLESGAYTVDAGELESAVPSMVRALEAAGATVRIERAETRAETPVRVDEILWWSPSEVRVPSQRGTVRVLVERE